MPIVSFSNTSTAQTVSIELGKLYDKSSTVQKQSITGKRNNTPQEEPTNQALYAQAMGTCSALRSGVNNCNQAVKYFNVAGSSMAGAKDLLIECQQYCVQANNTLTDDASRATLQESLEGILGSNGTKYQAAKGGSLMRSIEQTVWMGQPILSGKIVEGPFPTHKVIPLDVANFQTQGGSVGFNSSSIASLVNATNTGGIVEGAVRGVSVVTNPTDNSKVDVTITIGNSIYTGEKLDTTAAADWVLKGDNGSTLGLTVQAPATAQVYEAELKQAFGLLQVGTELATPAIFTSASVASQPVDGGGVLLYTTAFDERMPSGTYGISVVSMDSDGGGVAPHVVMSNGSTGSVIKDQGAGEYSFFGGGAKINFASAPVVSADNFQFTISNTLPFYCQIGATSNDVLEGNLPRVDLTSLGLADQSGSCNLDLTKMETATIASEKITLALARLSTISANIGTLQAQATSSAESSSTLYSNITDAATVYDAVDAPVMISKSIDFALRSANAVNSIMPGFTMSIQLKNQLASANQLASQA